MKLDDELFVELRKIAPDATVLCARDKAVMLAGYRLALERAARECSDSLSPQGKVFAAAIRALGREHE